MATKPMLFNTQMVRALLDERKTCTRRVVKPVGIQTRFWKPLHDRFIIEKVKDGWQIWLDQIGNPYTVAIPPCQPGDILYVRETWNGIRTGNDNVGYRTTYWYKADDRDENPDDKWRPSIHMPKEAARIFLRVTGVRVERLRDITADGALCEGIKGVNLGMGESGYTEKTSYCDAITFYDSPIGAFAHMWDSTIKPADLDRHGWAANPWVWVIEFERISKEAAEGGADND